MSMSNIVRICAYTCESYYETIVLVYTFISKLRWTTIINEGTKVHNPRRYNTVVYWRVVICSYIHNYVHVYIRKAVINVYGMCESTGKYTEVWQRCNFGL